MTPQTLPQALTEIQTRSRFINYIQGENQETEISYQVLYERALGILYYFQQQGVQPGSELMLLLESDEQFVDAFWACQLGGIVAVPVAVGASPEHQHKVFRIFDTLKRPRLLTNGKIMARLKLYAEKHALESELARLRQHTVDVELIAFGAEKGARVEPDPNDTALVQFSSGSTGEPKGVVLSHKNLLCNVQAIITAAAITKKDSLLSWMPLTHDMGLIGFHLAPLVLGIDQYKMPPEVFARRPLLWMSKASEKKVTLLSSPNFGYRHFLKVFQQRSQQHWDLDRVRLMFNGAEPISATLAAEFCSALAPLGLKPRSMFPVYGLAEASLAVTFSAPETGLSGIEIEADSLKIGEPPKLLKKPGCTAGSQPPAALRRLTLVGLGQTVPHCELRITDGENQPVSLGSLGHIQIRGANVTRGYYTRDTRSGLISQSFFTQDGWLDTGDLGFMQQQNLYVSGRSKDTIIIHGANYFPADLEQICAELAAIDSQRVVCAGAMDEQAQQEKLVVFLRHRGELSEFIALAQQLKHHLAEQTLLDVSRVVPVEQIPRTSSGKVQRYRLLEALARGDFDRQLAEIESLEARQHSETVTSDTANESAMQALLLEILHSIIPDQEIGVHDNLIDLGADSLALVQLLEEIDERYPDLLEITDFLDYQSVAELAAYLDSKLTTQSSAAE